MRKKVSQPFDCDMTEKNQMAMKSLSLIKRNTFWQWRTIKALIPRILLQMGPLFQNHYADQKESM